MWNSPRFCFNSYLELDRRMRMRARCAAWQLWVSEKFSLLSVVNTRPVYTYNTPKTQFSADITSTADSLELIPLVFARQYFPQEVRVCINGAQGPQCLPLHYRFPSGQTGPFLPTSNPQCTTEKTAPTYVHLLRARAIIRHAHAGANCKIKYSGLHKIHPKWHFKPPQKTNPNTLQDAE